MTTLLNDILDFEKIESGRMVLEDVDFELDQVIHSAAMLMAGLDGIMNKIDPGGPIDKDFYDLSPEEEKGIPTVCYALEQALDALDEDRDFLKAGGVLTDDAIDAYIELKMDEVTTLRMATHPAEFDMYYSV